MEIALWRLCRFLHFIVKIDFFQCSEKSIRPKNIPADKSYVKKTEKNYGKKNLFYRKKEKKL